MLALLLILQHALMHGVEPRFSVGIGQWNSGRHFPPIFFGMIIVSIFELPSGASGQQLADGRLADAAHTHQDNDHELRSSNLSR